MQPKWILFQKKKTKQNKRNKRKNIFASSPIPCLHANIASLRLHVKVTLIHYVVSLPFPSLVASAEYTCTLRSFLNISRVACAIIRLQNFQKRKCINNKTRKLTA